jgi:hypothetical protein
MQVKNIVQASAIVVRVSEVHPGDVYKRIDKPSYGDERLVYGKVMDVLSDGEDAALVTLEFVPVDYSSNIQAVVKTFRGEVDVTLFPATVAEYENALNAAIDAQEKTVMSARADYDSKTRMLDRLLEAMSEDKHEVISSTVAEITK